MSWPTKGIILVVVFVLGMMVGIRWHVGQVAIRDLQTANERAREVLMRHERQNTSAAKHEADKDRIRVEYVTITKEVEKIVEKPFYRDACFDDDGLRVLREAIAGNQSTGQPDAALPGSAKP